MHQRVVVPSADFIRRIGFWQNEALQRPIAISHHGRARLVLAAAAEFEESAGQAGADLAERETRALKASFAAMLENMPCGYLAADSGLNILSLNSAAEAFLGRPREDLIDRPVLAAAHGMFGSVLSERMRRALRARQTESFEIEASEGRSVAVQVFPISEGVAALIQNTTEQERLKRQRAESDAFEAACCAHAALTRIKLDLNGRIAFIGDTFCKASGFTTDELIGHRFTDLVAALRRRAFANALEQAFRTLKPLHMPLTLIGKTGVEFSGDFAFAPAHIDFIARGGEAVWLASSPAAVAPTA